MLLNVVPHDGVIAMCVNADIRITGETEGYDVAEYMVDIRITGHTMNNMIRSFVI